MQTKIEALHGSGHMVSGRLCGVPSILSIAGILLTGCLPGALSSPGPVLPALVASPAPALPVTPTAPSSLNLVSSVPPGGTIAVPTQPIQITFSAAVVPGSCSVDPANTDIGTPATITLTYSGSSVTATPAGAWTAGLGRKLVLSGCQGVAGGTSGGYLVFYLPAGTVYISPTGADANTGLLPTNPKIHVADALAVCGSPPCAVLAMGGSYFNQSPITTASDYVVIGGYDATFTTPGSAANPTIFADTSGAVGTLATPTAALSIQNATGAHFSHITVESAASATVAFPAAVWVQDAVATLQNVNATACTGLPANCLAVSTGRAVLMSGMSTLTVNYSTLDGGQCSGAGCTTVGLADDGVGPQTVRSFFSTFKGGTAAGLWSNSYAMRLGVAKTGSLLEANVILGGAATNAWGLWASGFAGEIERNFITGGGVVAAGGQAQAVNLNGFAAPHALRSNVIFGGYVGAATGTTVPIWWNGGNGSIYGNIIDGGYPGAGNLSHSYFMGGQNPDIRNNLFTGWTGASNNHCIDFMPGAMPANLISNGFYHCNAPGWNAMIAYDTIDTGGVLSTSALVPLPVTGTNSGNVIATSDPGWISQDYASLPSQFNFNYAFRSDGTALCSITQGGAALPLPADAQDATFTSRTAPWSMGPFEYDGPCQ